MRVEEASVLCVFCVGPSNSCLESWRTVLCCGSGSQAHLESRWNALLQLTRGGRRSKQDTIPTMVFFSPLQVECSINNIPQPLVTHTLLTHEALGIHSKKNIKSCSHLHVLFLQSLNLALTLFHRIWVGSVDFISWCFPSGKRLGQSPKLFNLAQPGQWVRRIWWDIFRALPDGWEMWGLLRSCWSGLMSGGQQVTDTSSGIHAHSA